MSGVEGCCDLNPTQDNSAIVAEQDDNRQAVSAESHNFVEVTPSDFPFFWHFGGSGFAQFPDAMIST